MASAVAKTAMIFRVELSSQTPVIVESLCAGVAQVHGGRICVLGQVWAYMGDAQKIGLGRIADERDKSPYVRSWLKAVGQRIINYVGLTPSTGHPVAERRLPSA